MEFRLQVLQHCNWSHRCRYSITTSERDALASKKKGQIIFNESKSRLEYYDGNQWIFVDVPIVVSGSDVTEVDSNAGGNQTFVIMVLILHLVVRLHLLVLIIGTGMHHQQHLIIQVS